MSELSEKTRERYREEGFVEGSNTERLSAIKLFKRVADSDDIEEALLEAIGKLETVQAHQVAAALQGKAGSQRDQAREFASTMSGGASSGGKDLVDTLAEMLRAQRGTL
jgi:hypothetical protein